MTSTHCIFRDDLSVVYAQDVVPGETKILVLDEANEFIPVTVDNLIIVRLLTIDLCCINTSFVFSVLKLPFEIRNTTLATSVSIHEPAQ